LQVRNIPLDQIDNELKGIKNIIFDFGNVLLDIDYQLSYEALSKLLNIDLQEMPVSLKKVFDNYEKGAINLETFLWNLQQHANSDMPHGHQLIPAWNAMLIGMQSNRFDFLRRLQKNFKVYLLSNTNATHLDWVYAHLKKVHKITDFDETYFDKTYYSHLVEMRKPDPEIYQYVQADAQLIPNETIFFDDIEVNLDAPDKLGWFTYLHDPQDDIIEVVEKKLRLLA
jgi:glucose-1-phosphatase